MIHGVWHRIRALAQYADRVARDADLQGVIESVALRVFRQFA